ncbi:hypothetical protein [Helicobacter canis]|uniref:hypothetical protein n=1 Tax=Helicobacter canis TaxID=29419 RepID=UPI0011C049F8|nr:hypothetical protein [Helicobacter canis]
MLCHDSATAESRNDRKTALSLESTFKGCLTSQSRFYFRTILRVAVGLWVFFTNFGRELP